MEPQVSQSDLVIRIWNGDIKNDLKLRWQLARNLNVNLKSSLTAWNVENLDVYLYCLKMNEKYRSQKRSWKADLHTDIHRRDVSSHNYSKRMPLPHTINQRKQDFYQARVLSEKLVFKYFFPKGKWGCLTQSKNFLSEKIEIKSQNCFACSLHITLHMCVFMSPLSAALYLELTLLGMYSILSLHQHVW